MLHLYLTPLYSDIFLTVNSYVIFLLPTPKATLNLLYIPQPPINVQINTEPVGDAELEGHRSKLSQLRNPEALQNGALLFPSNQKEAYSLLSNGFRCVLCPKH
ncbi:hypothetical protein CHARACLAT_021229 [Characodon lateralis]|uniref:Uncharacterized protein n=1 Tax=Characodon lateralis TaxID=208331 RepID=A0ABU7DME0_9TELE|nr:hypothetical protein [Characodon lateralis]